MFFNKARAAVVDANLREGDRPGEMIADTENWLEQLFSGIAAIGVLLMVAPIFLGVFDLLLNSAQMLQSMPEKLLGSMAVGTVIFAVGYQLRTLVDFYHILDFNEKRVLWHRRILDNESRSFVCDFSEIHSLATDSKRISRSEKKGGGNDSYRHWYEWHYGLVLILGSGKKIKIIDHHNVHFSDLHIRARNLAEKMGLQLHGESEKFLRLRQGPGGPEVWWSDETRSMELTKWGCFGMLCLLLLSLGMSFMR